MLIEFSWETGSVSVNADKWISNVIFGDVAWSTFKKWVKMFAQYGTRQQHCEFINLLEERMHDEVITKACVKKLRKMEQYLLECVLS